ncbi:MAG: insulinase family protein [Anaerolineae bacterium]|nr:insulinase family protein [Anaerolineae bacterium]
MNYPSPDTIHRHILPNGIIILAYENFASESVVIEGLVRAGTIADPIGQEGLASFTAAALMHGTAKRDFDAIYEDLESVGADLSINGSKHSTDFGAGCLVEDTDLVLDLLAEALRHPTFPPAQIEQVRGQIMTGLTIRANDTQQMATLAFNQLLYPNHPYGRSSRGYTETIQTITQADLVKFHQSYYGPQDMIICVVGAIAAETAVAKITQAFADWENVAQVKMPAVGGQERPLFTQHTHIHMPDKAQADLILGLPGPARSAPDYLHASLMNTILGVFGMMGRIGQNVREEQGLAYYAYSTLHGDLGPSPWTASAGVAPEDVEQATASILAEIERIQTHPVTTEELADSKAYRTGSLPVSLETNSGLASVIIDMELYNLGLDYLQRFPSLINAITVEDVQTAAQKYLSTDQIAIAVAGPDITR